VTHQEIGGVSDQEFVERMAARYPRRFNDEYWSVFKANVGRHLPAEPMIVDLGCGPGLYLRDLSERHRGARLHGVDATPAMIDHARQLRYQGAAPTLVVQDVEKEPLPLDAAGVDLVSMTGVLHVLEDPFAVLAEVLRVLRPGGLFLLDDWVRMPLAQYVQDRPRDRGAAPERQHAGWLRMFPFHNKYTAEDWKWLLAEAGFSLVSTVQIRPQSQIFVAMVRTFPAGT
jgi:SAM-dependent methyltransferase